MKSKIVKCVDCGEEYPRKELNRNSRCPKCRPRALMDAMLQMQAHSGKYYEKWRKAMKEKGLARLEDSLDRL